MEGRVNICNGKGIFIRDYVLTLAKMTNKENLVIFRDTPNAQQVSVIGDNTRLKEEVKFTPRYSLKAAFKEILAQ